MPKYKYETDAGTIVRVRMSEAKKTIAGDEPAGTLDESNWYASISTSKRSQTRLKARGFIYSREVTVADETRKLIFTAFFPKLTPTTFDATAPATVSYDGETWNFVRKSSEE